MITIRNIQNINYATYDEVWAIVRSLKYTNPHIRHVPELSPSWSLFKQYMNFRNKGNWNEETFRKVYVPQFLKEMRGEEQQKLLNYLFSTNKHICLVCFCQDESLCHRSIIGGMLQGAGATVNGLTQDYSCYFNWWKNDTTSENTENIKNISDNNKNVRYLYELQPFELFDEDIPTMCFTGRRPKDLCWYDASKYKSFVSDLAKMIYDEFYVKKGIRRFITGGAQGFDQMSFWAVEKLKSAYGCKDIQNIVFVPFVQQEVRWAETGCFSQAEYWQMIKHADMVVVVSEDNDIESLFARNHAMCDYSDYCLALYPDRNWSESKGGTAECLRYAVMSQACTFRLGYTIDDAGLHIGTMVLA